MITCYPIHLFRSDGITLSLLFLGMLLAFTSMNAQDNVSNDLTGHIVYGTIISPDDAPLDGVNVYIKGTQEGTRTDLRGNYQIHVKSNQVLVFSHVGYIPMEKTITDSEMLYLRMVQDIQELSPVVISGDDEMHYCPESSLGGYSMHRASINTGFDPVREERIRKRRLAQRNAAEFKRIKRQRKKEEKKSAKGS